MSLGRALTWSAIWVGAALAFAAVLADVRGPAMAQLFLTGYVLEKALSIDNLMVFTAIFAYFRIPSPQQPRILRLGIIGAVVFRAIFVILGAGALLVIGPIVGAIFGLIVLWSAVKMLTMSGGEESETDYEAQWYVRLASKLSTTPAFICLVTIEISDLMFSFDSMPAVIAVARDPLIVYSAIMFAVLGLRSLYFVLDALMRYLTHLSTAVIAILFFVGAKLLLHSIAELTETPSIDVLNVSPMVNLAIVLGLLGLGIAASAFKHEAEQIELRKRKG